MKSYKDWWVFEYGAWRLTVHSNVNNIVLWKKCHLLFHQLYNEFEEIERWLNFKCNMKHLIKAYLGEIPDVTFSSPICSTYDSRILLMREISRSELASSKDKLLWMMWKYSKLKRMKVFFLILFKDIYKKNQSFVSRQEGLFGDMIIHLESNLKEICRLRFSMVL